jgi:hypothetical protein
MNTSESLNCIIDWSEGSNNINNYPHKSHIYPNGSRNGRKAFRKITKESHDRKRSGSLKHLSKVTPVTCEIVISLLVTNVITVCSIILLFTLFNIFQKVRHFTEESRSNHKTI